jgi:hypothetical protein
MRERCLRTNHPAFHRYGGRGIKVCARWDSFLNFLEDMGPKPGDGFTLERLNNDGDYEPDNCKWATPREQGNNRSDNRLLEFRGETLTIAEWASRLGLRHTTIRMRLEKGWSVEKALTPKLRPSTRALTLRNETLTLAEWSERTGIASNTIRMRLANGWGAERALTTPVDSPACEFYYKRWEITDADDN